MLGSGSLEIVEEGIVAVNISVCLVDRPDVCGPPTQALICEYTLVVVLYVSTHLLGCYL